MWDNVTFYSVDGIDFAHEDMKNYTLLEAKDTEVRVNEELKIIGRFYKKINRWWDGIEYLLLEYLPTQTLFAIDEPDYSATLEADGEITICLYRMCSYNQLSAQLHVSREGITITETDVIWDFRRDFIRVIPDPYDKYY